MFITFEGIEGVGKTTQINLLKKFLEQNNKQVLITREPGGTKFGKKLREILLNPENNNLDPLAELFLYLADRAQHVNSLIKPALDKKKWVLCDRFVDSNIVYQGYGRGMNLELLKNLNLLATSGLKPNKTILLDTDLETSLYRARARNKELNNAHESRFDNESFKFHQTIQGGFQNLANQEPERFIKIRTMPTALETAKIIENHIKQIL